MGKLEKEVPFDQYSRQSIAQQLIDSLRKHDQVFKVLDVGGYKGRTADFLPHDEVTVLDVFDVDEDNYVKGDALNIGFANDSFDIVTSFDVLEHIPSEQRSRFVDECYRVAKKCVVIAAPNKTSENETAEVQLNSLYKSLHKKDHRWLKEHIEYSLPDFYIIDKQLVSKKAYTLQITSNDIFLWFLMQEAVFLNSKYPIASEQLVKVNEYYNKNFKYDGGETTDSYRIIEIGIKNKKDFNLAKKILNDKIPKITSADRLKVMERLEAYRIVLLKKMSQQVKDYKKLYEYELNRANSLAADNDRLQHAIIRVREDMKISRRVRRIPKKIARAAYKESKK